MALHFSTLTEKLEMEQHRQNHRRKNANPKKFHKSLTKPSLDFRPVIDRKAIERLVKEIALENSASPNIRFQYPAVTLLHLAVEEFLSELFRESEICCKHGGRKEINKRDIRLAVRLMGVRRKPSV